MILKIRDMREDNDITQKKISEYLMCDQSLYSKYEREEREIPLHLIIMLAQYYQVSIDYLVGLTGEKTPQWGKNTKRPTKAALKRDDKRN